MADPSFDKRTSVPPVTYGGTLYGDPNSGLAVVRGPTGRCATAGGKLHNASVQDQIADPTGLVNEYINGSALKLPTRGISVGTTFRWRIVGTKTAAGASTWVWVVKIGTTGTTADTTAASGFGALQTAAADTGVFEITAVVRNVGTAGIVAAHVKLTHVLNITGWASAPGYANKVTGSPMDLTSDNLIAGVALTPASGTVATWQAVTAEALNV